MGVPGRPLDDTPAAALLLLLRSVAVGRAVCTGLFAPFVAVFALSCLRYSATVLDESAPLLIASRFRVTKSRPASACDFAQVR